MEIVEKTELEFREGSSDKIYIATLMKGAAGYQVRLEYGKRWNVNNCSYKPEAPSSFGAAKAVYEETLYKKRKKGYVPSTR